jgi:RHH-type rel operon transcriptional repressor/antitoxin RelB
MSNDVLGRPVSVRLPETLRARVEALAIAGRRSRGDVLREAMEREVDRLEWEYRITERAADVRAGRTQTVTLSELNAELGELGPVDMSVLDEIE